MTDFSNNKTNKLNDKFIFEPLNIEFDENFNPKEKNEDYMLLREIFTDPEVMKTSTFFACGVPEAELELHLAMIASTEPEKEFRKDYGLQKVWSVELGKYIGVSGLIRREKHNLGYVVEGMIFLKSEYLASGFGYWTLKILFSNLEKVNGIMVASVWEKNFPSIRLIQKNGMTFAGNAVKIYKEKEINIDLYYKFSEGARQSGFLLQIDTIKDLLGFTHIANLSKFSKAA